MHATSAYEIIHRFNKLTLDVCQCVYWCKIHSSFWRRNLQRFNSAKHQFKVFRCFLQQFNQIMYQYKKVQNFPKLYMHWFISLMHRFKVSRKLEPVHSLCAQVQKSVFRKKNFVQSIFAKVLLKNLTKFCLAQIKLFLSYFWHNSKPNENMYVRPHSQHTLT
jgi:hypothetical protein